MPRPHIPRFFSFFFAQSIARRLVSARGQRFDAVISTGPDVLRPTVAVFHCSAAAFAEFAGEPSQEQVGSAMSRLKRWNSALSYKAIAAVERLVVRRGAARVVVISTALKKDIERFHGSMNGRLSVLPDGVDLLDFRPRPELRDRVRAELDIRSDQPVVLFVGHNWLRKGLPALAAAMKLVKSPDSMLVVAGAGECTLKDEITQLLAGRARFLGVRSDMPALYAAADVVALPTLQEPFGLPVLEAMACGVPVIVSRAAGVAELITDGGDGLLLEDPTDVREIAHKLDDLLGAPERRIRIGQNAVATAAKFSWDALAADFEAILIEGRA